MGHKRPFFVGAADVARIDAEQVRVEHFPFGIVFRERPDEIAVMAVVHFKHRPGYWRGRG